MLIRSQDKKSITNCLELKIVDGIVEGEDICTSGGKFLGHYSTEEKAIKVLDMICEKYQEPICENEIEDYVKLSYENIIFQMPQDEEVKV